MMPGLLTLLTDFGLADPYVGVVKGVMLGINPQARLVDLTHLVPPQDIRTGAFLLHTAVPFFPSDAVHFAVVDPGVGTARRPLAMATPRGRFVAPDNGLLSFVLAAYDPAGSAPSPGETGFRPLPPGCRAVHLTNRAYWLPQIGYTFHGRDLFAPVAAHLSLGVSLEELGEPVDAVRAFPVPRPERRGGRVLAHVIHFDHFGNAVTDLRPDDLPGERPTFELAGRLIHGLSRSYGDAEDQLLALIGSHGYVEIALRERSAREELGLRVGEVVVVR